MAVKKKISVRKVLQVAITFVVTVSCIIAITASARVENQKTVDHIEVHINSGKKYHFIEEKQILDETINNRNIDVMHTPLNKLDIQSMERVLKADPWVADASLYVDARRTLHMSVTQRIPIARLFQQNGSSCYMDNTLSIMPLAPNFIFYTSVVTNVPVLGNDSISRVVKGNIATLLHKIQADTFWNAQVSQVVIDSDKTFELIPVLGQQRIIFGDTSRMNEKFNNLHAFYLNVLNRIGWDKYETLDVRFKAQVVASPSLPYKGPVDKAAPAMNWINSITQTEARIDSMHALKEDAKSEAKTEQPSKPEATPAKATPAKPEKKDDKKDNKNAPHTDAPKNKKEPIAKQPEKKPNEKRAPAKDDKKALPANGKKDSHDTKSVKKTDRKADKKDISKDKKKDKKDPKKDNKKVEKKSEKPSAKKNVDNKGKTKDEKKPKYVLPEQKHN